MSKRNKGIYLNCDPIDQSEGYYREGENIILDEEMGAVLNEKGTSQSTTLPIGSTVIGSYLLTNDESVVFLDRGTIGSEIGIFTGSGYQEKLKDTSNNLLNFSTQYPIQADLYVDKNGDRIITWVDGNNPARFLNIDNVGTPSDASLNLFPSISKAPKLEVTDVNNTGGSLKTGTYYIAIAYKHQDETLTNFYDVVGPIPIIRDAVDNDELFRGSDADLETSKSISMSFGNVDTEYESIQLAVIPVYGGVIDAVQLLPEIPITTTEYTYTGGESFEAGSLEEIQIDQAFYSKPQTLHINNDTIYLGNLQQQRDIGYQKYAKDITVTAVTKEIPDAFSKLNSSDEPTELENSFRNPINSVYNKSFKRGEVYALYISWILKEGGESKAYHIRGRAPVDNDDFATNSWRSTSAANDPIGQTPKYMGYWENDDEPYPNDSDVWGNLAGEKVRHHHFPEMKKFPVTVLNNLANGNISVYSLGFKLTNIPLPPEIKEQVTGYKIYYAKRTDKNKRIVDQAVNIESTISDDLYVPHIVNRGDGSFTGTVNKNAHYLHPFHLLRTKDSLAQITKLKAVGEFIDETEVITTSEGKDITTSLFSFRRAGSGLGTLDDIRITDSFQEVEAISYIDSEETESNINLKNQGFSHNMNNYAGESKILVSVASGYNEVNNTYAVQNGTAYYLIDLLAFKTNVYNSFDNQILESTNYVHTDLESPDSAEIYGGDTFINLYTYKLSSPGSNTNVITMICESEDNISYRRVGENAWEGFYPHFDKDTLRAVAWKDGKPTTFSANDKDVFTYDNYFHYNEDYSKTNDIRFPTLKEKLDKEPEKYPSRVIRNKGDTSRLTRVFLPDDYIDLTTKRGELTKLTTYNNILIPHMERSLIRTKGREELQVGDIRAFLGTGDIFSVKPEELIYSEDGFGGIEAKEHSISTPYGYAFYDKDAHKMFLINHDGMQDIGEPIKPILDTINPTFIRMGYDPKFERLFVTFNNDTWSYSFKIKGWMSKHSFIPNWYLSSKDAMYTAKKLNSVNTYVYEHNANNIRGKYYESLAESLYSYIDNRNPTISKVVMSLMINSIREGTSGDVVKNKTFDQFRISNTIQDTGIVDIEYFANEPLNPYIGNARRTVNKWFINQFRDITAIPSGTPAEEEWQYKKKLEDHYHKVDLIKDNSNGEKITLTDTDLIYKNSIR